MVLLRIFMHFFSIASQTLLLRCLRALISTIAVFFHLVRVPHRRLQMVPVESDDAHARTSREENFPLQLFQSVSLQHLAIRAARSCF